MKINVVIAGFFVAGMAMTSAVKAQRTPVINQREHHQVGRINQGVSSGALTHSEAAHLRAREQNIRADKRMAKATGTMTPARRANLNARENRLSRSIYRKKHN
ncbi:hypothetical protein DIU31_024390 [Mucilaginibacter rubeus]|uniref:DUF4148 domain-containing protein n=1 Tax=Mucilaginibacter rubeus TaxID=2027860 RepID=A0AAE6MK94_9SPHI|nr:MULTISPECIES: hypothetical protein [Mucilaginibacter]QEM06500.1 hypothetical protein DIU31_024390 [Mucilaginibacter rubeus]QEM19088.1 hypothetical protein DIU38_024650 [Mucilaginibacter gossypii]QTE44369.1 hypothetical protein J3L19_03060 [Mucilaginibacter rubeus]QTE50969.1 hypothetical protein J3L21_03035 [Mucilaginibacter rubeus]QTE56052.1 hypothetical protein J3L23_28270 [Mucilaginibacter rubeus]